MAEEPPPSSPIIPYLDSFDGEDISFIEDVLMLDETPNAEFTSLTQQPDNFAFNNHSSIPQYTVIEANGLPIINPFATSGMLINSTAGIPQVVPRIASDRFRGKTSHDERRMFLLQPEDTLAFGNPEAPLPVWPAPQVPYACSCCQVLREITHTKGNYVTKLDIHGRLGFICHAVLENRFVSGDWTTQSQYYQMIDFSKKSIEAVKEYLVQYCQGRQQEGYTIQKDHLLPFYEALCVGLTNKDHGSWETDQFIQPSWENLGDQNQVNQPEPLNQIGARRDEARLSLAEQRERTSKLTITDLMEYFHLPIEDAAKEMKVCPTVLKKICRKYNLHRWPHRKIKSIEKKISTRRQSLDGTNAEERARAQQDIESFQQELGAVYKNLADAEMSSIPLG